MAYSFFFSYARADLDGNRIHQFFERLDQEMRGRRLPGGFLDRNLEPGTIWNQDAADSLSSTPVLVAMYSPNFFGSEYCGKEVQMFLERRRAYLRNPANRGKKRPQNMIPVLWRPCQPPRALPGFNYLSPKAVEPAWNDKQFGTQYLLFVKNDTHEALCNALIYRLADEIQEQAAVNLTTIEHGRLLGLSSAFEPLLPLYDFESPLAEYGPESVTFVYAASDWAHWPFWPPAERAALHAVSAVAKGKEIEPHQLAFDVTVTNLQERLLAARRKNNIVILLVDGGSIDDPAIRPYLTEFDALKSERSSVMVLWTPNQTPALDRARAAFPFYSGLRPPNWYDSIDSFEKLETAVIGGLEALQSAILRNPQRPNPIEQPSSFQMRPQISAAQPAAGAF